MVKRAHVPSALHAELTEYSSLLRALRTTNTLDLTLHLTAKPSEDEDSEADDEDVDDDRTNDPPLTESETQDALSSPLQSRPSTSRSRSRSLGRSSGNAKQKDLWTRWPLLAGDVHVPEWGLTDEVKHIAQHLVTSAQDQVLNSADGDSQSRASSSRVSSPSPVLSDREEDHPGLSSLGLRTLTADSSAFVARLLGLLAAHVPAAEKSMQNRIRPICWETVIDVVSHHGAISPSVAKHVRERMSTLYPPSQPNVLHRVEHLFDTRTKLSDMLSKYDDRLLALPTIQDLPKPQLVKRKRGPYKKRNTSMKEVDEPGPAPKRQRSDHGRDP